MTPTECPKSRIRTPATRTTNVVDASQRAITSPRRAARQKLRIIAEVSATNADVTNIGSISASSSHWFSHTLGPAARRHWGECVDG